LIIATDDEMVKAAAAYANAEKYRRTLEKQESSVFEWNAIEEVYECEKKLVELFRAGETNPRINFWYLEYRKMLVDPPPAQA
jgi:hypothetical protein